MNKAVLFFMLLVTRAGLYAQQPPAQLPSLLEDNGGHFTLHKTKEKPEDILGKNIFVKVEASKKTVSRVYTFFAL